MSDNFDTDFEELKKYVAEDIVNTKMYYDIPINEAHRKVKEHLNQLILDEVIRHEMELRQENANHIARIDELNKLIAIFVGGNKKI